MRALRALTAVGAAAESFGGPAGPEQGLAGRAASCSDRRMHTLTGAWLGRSGAAGAAAEAGGSGSEIQAILDAILGSLRRVPAGQGK